MNPKQIIDMMIKQNPNVANNPIMNNAFNLMQCGDVKGLQGLAQNLAKEKGVDINALKRQLETNMHI